MKLQILSDLHLETEQFDPQPAPGAEALVLAGDIDSGWEGLARFAGWPVPVIFVAGNHEFDRRELRSAWPALRERCEALGLVLLERQSLTLVDAQGQRVRFLGTVRWSDFDLFGALRRDKVMRAARYFVDVMRSTRDGAPFDATAVREEALACRAWLEGELRRPRGDWDRTVVVTHYGPSLRSADPRYGAQPGTASFCNADDDLLARAELWIHGHLHCRQDWREGRSRVVSNARGHSPRGEAEGYDGLFTVEV
ncbi:metallophosphoesterase [Caldimonas tepidiphila]|uniref:metallophosphoesterase n=1 Tax=Caldimonas tepidiphila TaxID=2315841 RepID=UPI000E5A8263|nr:metallophosphoesterase [Caldimonas tepidiphila]